MLQARASALTRMGRGAAGGIRSVAGSACTVPVRTAKSTARTTAGLLPACASMAARTIGDLGPARTRRRVWAAAGRAHIEVRGLTGRGVPHRKLAKAVTSGLDRLEGVDWTAVNAVTRQVLVGFDEDTVSTEKLVEVIESIESAHDTDQKTFEWSRPQHPGDDTHLAATVTALVADAISLVGAVTYRLSRIPPLPRGVRAPIILLDAHPRLRDAMARRIGLVNTDLLLGIANATAYGLGREPTPLAMDMLYRVLHLGELQARRAAWVRRERELCAGGEGLPQETHEHRPRPKPLPDGPIEKLTDRTAALSLLGATGILTWTRDLEKAAYAILVMVPKAARLGREAFATTLARDLARRGAVPLDGSVFRRLDRVSTVVIDSEVLCGARPQILSAVATSPHMDDAEVWRAAHEIVGRCRDAAQMSGAGPWARGPWRLRPAPDAKPGRPDGPVAMTLDLFDAEDAHRGRVRVGCELDPLADALLSAARAGADRLVLTEHDSVAELLPWADEVLSGGRRLAHQVRDLQSSGRGVVLIAGSHDDALDAADAGVAVLQDAKPVPWAADLLTGPGLAEACRVLHALPAARKASERSARVGLGGSALGTLIASVGRGRQGALGMAPVHSATLIALLIGAFGARRLAGEPDPRPIVRAAWHTLTAEDALTRLTTVLRDQEAPTPKAPRPAGLPAAVAALRTRLLPVDRLPTPPPWLDTTVSTLTIAPIRGATGLLKAMGEELRDPLTPVLALGAAASAVVGSSVDAWLVSSVVAGNAAVSSLQRMRAERALSSLLISEEVPARRMLWSATGTEAVGQTADETGGEANAFRGLITAPVEMVPGHELNIGDVIMLCPSDVVPADARLLIADDLEVDESSLTGESLPVIKSVDPTPGAALGDRTCMVYESTAILAGTAYALVVATGPSTEAGRATAAAGRPTPPAGIQAHLSELTRVAMPTTGLAGMAVTGLGLLRGIKLTEAVSSGIAIAVAAVPEGLPLVATVSQLAAARRLSRRGVLVRSSRSLEALGRVDTLCFDKTGTLTEGRLAVTAVAGPGGVTSLDDPLGRRLLQVAAHASPQPNGTGTVAMPHATDRAIVESARVHNIVDDGWRLVDELPFEASRGFSASLGKEHERLHLAVKGAPEVVLARCSTVLAGTMPKHDEPAVLKDTIPTHRMTPERAQAARALIRELAGSGLRVLAVAERRLGAEQDPADIEIAGWADDLTLLGFVAISDVPRASAAGAIARLAEIGVRVTMITGDHPVTAVAVAKILGIPDADRVLTGAELDVMPDGERVKRTCESTVFARVSPEQKVGIVQALQRAGHVVAMTGDGSNDAPAIRLSDVGIGVSGRGSAVARNAADLVLADPDTQRIVEAMLEGRSLWSSVRDAVSILVGGNAGEVAFTLLATFISGRAPLRTRQFLLVNLLTDMLPALAVALAPVKTRGDGAEAAGTGPVPSVMAPELARTIAVRGASTAFGAMLAWRVGSYIGGRRRAGTMALGALVGAQLGQTVLARSRSPLVILTAAISAIALMLTVETPGVSHFFQCTPLGPVGWAIVIGSAAAATVVAAFAPHLLPAEQRPASP